MVVQPCLCGVWLEIPKNGFLTMRHIFLQGISNVVATVADYDADRESEKKRLEQTLQDLEESFSKLEGTIKI